MNAAITISGLLLAIAATASLFRIAVGPSIADRMVALDTLLFIGGGALALQIVATGDPSYVPVLVVLVLTAFISTIVVARYIEAETDR